MRSKDNQSGAGTPEATGQEPIPEPAWRADRRGQTAPRVPLTRDAILEAALRVLEREGMDGLSMRRVAEELGTGAASLYWHVRNKDELLQLVFERLSAEVVLPPPDPSCWQEQLRELGRQLRAVAHQRRDFARLSLGRIPAGPTLVRFAEWLYELLTPIGIPDRVIAYVGDLMSLYVGAYTFEESLGPMSPTGEALSPEQIGEMFRDYLRSLPADQFPHVHRAAGDLFGGDADERFEFGLDVIIKGIEAYAGTAGGGRRE
jgi:AcrR family transcriptional regulator